MFVFIGLAIVMLMVFGSFGLHGGSFGVILEALPWELMMILGGAIGGFISGNTPDNIKGALNGIKLAIKGNKWATDDYKDLLCLLFLLVKTIRTKGVVAIEAHIEDPQESKIFQYFPRVSEDHHAVEFICDYIRMMTMSFEDPNQMEDAMDRDLEKHHKEEHEPGHSLQVMADGLPAIGIVAAVLGIIKTMGSISQPVEILGGMVGSALVGTFLGIFLSYLVFAPFAQRFNQIAGEDAQFMNIIRYVLIAHLHNNAPQISVEIGRRNVPTRLMPSFIEIEDAIADLPPDLK